MKNTARVRKHVATKHAVSQVQTPVSPFQAKCRRGVELNAKEGVKPGEFSRKRFPDYSEFLLPTSDGQPACLAVFERESGVPLTKIPLTDGEFYELQKRRIQPGGRLENFVAEAIRHKLYAPAEDGITELEQATAQSNALMQLLTDKFEHLARLDGSHFEGSEVNRLVFGISELAKASQARLDKSYKQVFAALHPKKPEVGS